MYSLLCRLKPIVPARKCCNFRSSPACQLLRAADYHERTRVEFLSTLESGLDAAAESLDRSGVRAHSSVYASLLRRSGNARALAIGKQVHANIARHGADGDTFIGNLLVQMYGKCGSLENARQAFDAVGEKNVFSWNLMLAAFAQNGHYTEALRLFHRMGSERVKPNAITFASIINVCSTLGNLAEGRAVHAQIAESRIPLDAVLATALINMYGKCSSLQDARRIFDAMPPGKNVVAWNSMIALYVQNENCEEALRLFRGMEGVKPSIITFTTVLRACCSMGQLAEGKAIHASLIDSGVQWDVVVGNTLIDMYGKCGSVDDARRVFDRMHERNIISWTTMATAYAQQGHCREALELYGRMNMEGVRPQEMIFSSFLTACCNLKRGKAIHEHIVASGFDSDTAVANALVTMYGRCGSLPDAKAAFEATREKNVISWTAMVSANAQNGHLREALKLFQTMASQGVRPNAVTCMTILDACSTVGTLADGRVIQAEVRSSGFDSVVGVNNALVNMYGKCGSLEDARAVFEEMRDKNLVSWTSIIAAYAHQGHGRDALELYRNMEVEGVKADDIAFVSVLSALGHTGLVEDCRLCFMTMVGDHGVEPIAEHYNCLIDLLGRAGWLEKAKDLLDNMPFEPAIRDWMSFLGSCKIHGDLKRGVDAAKRASELNPAFAAPYLMLLKIYAGDDGIDKDHERQECNLACKGTSHFQNENCEEITSAKKLT